MLFRGLIKPNILLTGCKKMSETITTPTTPDTKIPPSRFEVEDQWQERIDAQPLPPVDGGKHAYRFLGAAFVIEGLVWVRPYLPMDVTEEAEIDTAKGFPGSYGVLLEHYLRGPLGTTPGAQTLIPLVGTLNSGIMFLAGTSSTIPTRFFFLAD
jgi:MCP family monocarboxylic acid transporter-like MFS transporter 10